MTDDLISRHAVRLIESDSDAYPEVWNHDYERGFTDAIIRVIGLPSVNQWTPCSERLPVERTNPNTHDFEYVICSTTFGDVRAYKFGAPIGHDEPHFWHGAGIMDEYVLAWMPLPEPYKGEEE